MNLKKRDFKDVEKTPEDLLRGIRFWLQHGDEGVAAEAARIQQKQAAKAAQAKPDGKG